jgi:hypothetical protein
MYGRDIFRQLWQIAVTYLVLVATVDSLRDCFVDTELGPVIGSTEKSRNGKRFCSFRGIPYAAPPIGHLRFEVSEFSWWPCGLRHRSEAAWLLGSCVRILLEAWMFVSVLCCWSRGSSVSIVSGYGLDDRAIEFRCPAGVKDFSSSLRVQTGSGVHLASCTMGTGGPFPGTKRGRA